MAVIVLNLKAFEEKQRGSKINNSKLAKAMGIDRSQLWRVKQGKNNPGQDFIAGALKAFPGSAFDDFFVLQDPLRDSHGNSSKTG